VPRGHVAAQYAVGMLLGACVAVGVVDQTKGPDAPGPERATPPYLVKLAVAPEGLCRYFVRLNEGSGPGFGESQALILRKGTDVAISIAINAAPRNNDVVVAETYDINGTNALFVADGKSRSLRWRLGSSSVEMFSLTATREEVVNIARSLRFAFDENGTHLTKLSPGKFRPDGDLLRPSNSYGQLTYDDCVRDNQPSKGRPRREITITTSYVLRGAEVPYAKSFGRDATAKFTAVNVARGSKSIQATRAEASAANQRQLLYTWVESSAQVTVQAKGFSDDTVLDIISKLTSASVEDYGRMERDP
jgi:hypothetical protein